MELAPGDVFADEFRVVQHLGTGGMGAVYVVEHLKTGKKRALKVMKGGAGDEDLRRRFEQEARVGSLIQSEHVVDVLDAGVTSAGVPWLVMELLQGEDLETYCKRTGALAVKDASSILRELTHAVAAAHDIPVVHRDLKPENVYLARAHTFNSSRIVKVLDFGIAKILTGGPTTTGSLGTPMWMAPEQTDTAAKVSPATDVWAIGLIAFRLFSGKVFWKAAHAESGQVPILIREILSDPIPSASGRSKDLGGATLPDGFDEWFARCVAREQADRFQHAREAWNALAPLIGAEPSVVTAPAPVPEKSTQPDAFATTMASDPAAKLQSTTGHTAEITQPARKVAWHWWALGLAVVAGGAVWIGTHSIKHDQPTPAASSAPPLMSSSAHVETIASSVPSTAPSVSVSVSASVASSTKPVLVHKIDAGPKIDCEKDGFTIDAEGIKHYRRECLK